MVMREMGEEASEAFDKVRAGIKGLDADFVDKEDSAASYVPFWHSDGML